MLASFQPIRRSPIHHLHERHNVQFREQNGWLMASLFAAIESELAAVRASVGICDNSWCGKIEIGGPKAKEFSEGVAPARAKAYRIHDQHVILIIEPEAVEPVVQQLSQASQGKSGVYVVPN